MEMSATEPALKQAAQPAPLVARSVETASSQVVRTPPSAALGIFRGALGGLFIWVVLVGLMVLIA